MDCLMARLRANLVRGEHANNDGMRVDALLADAASHFKRPIALSNARVIAIARNHHDCRQWINVDDRYRSNSMKQSGHDDANPRLTLTSAKRRPLLATTSMEQHELSINRIISLLQRAPNQELILFDMFVRYENEFGDSTLMSPLCALPLLRLVLTTSMSLLYSHSFQR
jgi:hypothetical protein